MPALDKNYAKLTNLRKGSQKSKIPEERLSGIEENTPLNGNTEPEEDNTNCHTAVHQTQSEGANNHTQNHKIKIGRFKMGYSLPSKMTSMQFASPVAVIKRNANISITADAKVKR